VFLLSSFEVVVWSFWFLGFGGKRKRREEQAPPATRAVVIAVVVVVVIFLSDICLNFQPLTGIARPF